MRARASLRRSAFATLFFGTAIAAPLALAAPADDKPRVRIDTSKLADSGARPAPSSSIRITNTPADPSPLYERGQWIFDLRYDKGDVYLIDVHRMDLPAPQHTPRAMGRFAIELFEGPALVERVRFDFPMLGAGDTQPRDGGKWTPSFEKKLVSRIGVMFPATSKGTRLELWDRATDVRWTLPWPPALRATATTATASASATTSASATAKDGGAR